MFRSHMNTITCLVAALLITAIAHADDYEIDWYTIDGGGGTSTGGNFELSGTIGQPDAGAMAGADFELAGGFWPAAGETGSPCPADLTGDDQVDIDDLFAVLAAWGTCDECPEDINEDGVVDIDDLFAVLAAWGPCP